jgi:Rha family phage regulatory protein
MPDSDDNRNSGENQSDIVASSSSNASSSPTVSTRDGQVLASSRDVASVFSKEHRAVLRAIDDLIAQEPALSLRNFVQGSYTLPSTGGQEHRCFDMTRDGFTLLAMGFTGAKALKWKLAYIDAFNRMEQSVRSQIDASVALNDPTSLRILLLENVEKVLALQGAVEEMKPQIAAYERIAVGEGSMCITDAAKTLQVQPKALFSFLRSHRWIYSRPGGSGEIAYQHHLQSGLLEHKTTTVHRSDGSEKVVSQVRVTPKGLARLAQEFQPVARAA